MARAKPSPILDSPVPVFPADAANDPIPTAAAIGPEDDDDDEAEGEQESIDLAAPTLAGDLRDFILDRLRHEQDKRPWHERSEAEQRDTIARTERACSSIIRSALELIAASGRKSIKATVEKVVIKDGYQAVLGMPASDPMRHRLADSQGKTVLVIVADPETFGGERAPAPVKPDQGAMALETAGVVHSVVDESAADVPFTH